MYNNKYAYLLIIVAVHLSNSVLHNRWLFRHLIASNVGGIGGGRRYWTTWRRRRRRRSIPLLITSFIRFPVHGVSAVFVAPVVGNKGGGCCCWRTAAAPPKDCCGGGGGGGLNHAFKNSPLSKICNIWFLKSAFDSLCWRSGNRETIVQSLINKMTLWSCSFNQFYIYITF